MIRLSIRILLQNLIRIPGKYWQKWSVRSELGSLGKLGWSGRTMILLFLLGCLILLPIWGSQSKTALTEYSLKRPKSASVQPYRKGFTDDILVATADGVLHKLNERGTVMWSSPLVGGSLVSSFHPIKYSENRDRTETSLPPKIDSNSGTMIPSVRGSVLSYVGEELQSLDISVKELVEQTPKLSSDGTLFLGSKQSTVFGVDVKDGSMIEMRALTDESSKAWFARIDYLVRAVEAASGAEKWNFTFSEIVPFDEINGEEEDHDDNESELLRAGVVRELRVFADGSLLKDNGRGDRSMLLTPQLPSSIASAFVMKQKYEQKSQGGVLYLPQDGDDDSTVSAVSLRQLDIIHHLLSSKSGYVDSQSAVVAQIESISSHDHYLSLFAVEYLANIADLEEPMLAITASPSKCCLLDVFSSRKGLPSLPSRSHMRKDPRVKGPSTKLLISDINQSALVSRSANRSQRKPYELGDKVRGVGEDHSVCLEGGSNYPECIIGLHLLDNTSTQTSEPGEDSESPEKKHHHHPMLALFALLAMVMVGWWKDQQHAVSSAIASGIEALWSILPTRSRNGDLDSEGNLIVGALRLSDEKIGHGSMGTIVFRGALDGRPVAVKRMLCDYHAAATREMKLLIESDGHPNVVRYFVQETQGHFVYLALELCAMSLHEAMEQIGAVGGVTSAAVSGALLDMVRGVAFLHKQRIVHRDLKPHNILLAPRRCFSRNTVSFSEVRASLKTIDDLDQFTLKISDMGLGKLWLPGHSESVGRKGIGRECSGYNTSGSVHGTVGWQAPEVVVTSSREMHSTSTSPTATKMKSGSNWSRACSADIFSLGCILFHVLEPGRHLFGENWFDRESNIVHNKPVGLTNMRCSTARLLVRKMTSQYLEQRPSAQVLELHPMFWNQTKKISFLAELSDKIELEPPNSPMLTRIDKDASEVFGESWHGKVDACLLEDATKFRSYDVGSMRALLRVIRNKRNHWHELSPSVQELVSTCEPFPSGLMSYFEERFPRLLHHCYQVTEDLMSEDVSLAHYFGLVSGQTSSCSSIDHTTRLAEVVIDEGEEVDSPLTDVQGTMSRGKFPERDRSTQIDTVIFEGTDAADALGCRGWSKPVDHWLAAKGTSLPTPLLRASIDAKYRTRLCQHWDATKGTCCPVLTKGGKGCDFAHGPIEIRVKETKLHKWGSCTLKGQPGALGFQAEMMMLLQSGTSGGEDTYGAAMNVERIRRVDGKDEVEKQKLKIKKPAFLTQNRKAATKKRPP